MGVAVFIIFIGILLLLGFLLLSKNTNIIGGNPATWSPTHIIGGNPATWSPTKK